MKKTLWKDIKASFKHSLGRFFSIMLLMALGSFALVGLFVTGPDMRSTGKHYFNQLNVSDLTVIGDYGIRKDDQKVIEKAKNIKDIEYLYLKDVVVKNSDTSFRLFSKPQKISQYQVVEGRMPKSKNEIAIDDKYQDQYPLHSTISFEEKSDALGSKVLTQTKFKVVGYIHSGEILSSENKGQTTAGTGSLDSFGVVSQDVFNSDVYMMAKLTFKDTQGLDPYGDDYQQLIQKHKDELNKLLVNQPQLSLSSIKDQANQTINENQNKLDQAKNELEDARQQLESAHQQIDSAKSQIASNQQTLNKAQNQINEASTQIKQKEALLKTKQQEYQSGIKAYDDKNKQLSLAMQEYDQALKQVNEKESQLNSGKQQYETGLHDLSSHIQQIQAALTQPLPEEQAVQLRQQLTVLQTKYDQINQEYQTFLVTYDSGMKQIETVKKQLATKQIELQNAKSQLEKANQTLIQAKAQLDTGNKQINSAKIQLQSAKNEYQSGVSQLEKAKAQLDTKEQEYLEKLNQFNQEEPNAKQEIADHQEQLDDAKASLDKLAMPVYNVDTRREIPGGEGYKIYETVSDIVDSLAKIFPVFLYFVAAFVTFTTMTRFVDEERINAGTLRALGYEDHDIIKKFCVYGLVAGMAGTLLGIILGHTLLPYIVYNAYHHGFKVPLIEMHFYPVVSIVALVLSFVSAVLPAYVVAKRELQEQPARLLLPKPPAAGSKIFMEHITFVWKRLSFTHKVTCRNIFRYKQRMMMTIFGVAGAVALIFTGFGVQHSISGIKDSQFGNIIKYDMIVAENETATKKEQARLTSQLKNDAIKESTPIHYESVTKETGTNHDRQSITLIAAKNAEELRSYISLNDRKSSKKIELDQDGVVISERLSQLLDVKVGDTLSYQDSQDVKRTVKVSGICQMYTGHFIFMNQSDYEKVYHQDYTSNAYLVNLKNSSVDNTKDQAVKFMNLKATKGVVQNTTMTTLIDVIVTSLNKIMIVLILVAILLGTVILYNLTNINVSERIRELSTIKVLGFYDPEVTMYIYRETIVLSAIGIVVGWLIGMALHSYILAVVPPDEVMFNPTKWLGAYVIPLIVITVISYVLKYVVNHKLKKVDMLEALKSVD